MSTLESMARQLDAALSDGRAEWNEELGAALLDDRALREIVADNQLRNDEDIAELEDWQALGEAFDIAEPFALDVDGLGAARCDLARRARAYVLECVGFVLREITEHAAEEYGVTIDLEVIGVLAEALSDGRGSIVTPPLGATRRQVMDSALVDLAAGVDDLAGVVRQIQTRAARSIVEG